MEGLPNLHSEDIIGNAFINALYNQLQGMLSINQLLLIQGSTMAGIKINLL